ncbi:GTPase IMAP family member 4-like [Molossus nigricans]
MPLELGHHAVRKPKLPTERPHEEDLRSRALSPGWSSICQQKHLSAAQVPNFPAPCGLTIPNTFKRLAQDSRDSQLRLVLVGKTGARKTGKSILRKKAFISSISAKSITKVCEKGSSTWCGRKIIVMDMPGIFDTEVPAANTEREIAHCIVLTSPGPHDVLLVVRLGQYMWEEHKVVKKMLTMFGSKARRYMILIFTGKGNLDGMEFYDYLKEAPKVLQDLVAEIRDCHCVLNNNATGADQEAQRAQLLDMVQCMVMENEGGFYTNQMFQRAEVEIQKLIHAIQEQSRAELEREKRQIREEYKENIRKLQDEQERTMRKADMEHTLVERERSCAQRQQNARAEAEGQKDILDVILTVFSIVFFILKLGLKDIRE